MCMYAIYQSLHHSYLKVIQYTLGTGKLIKALNHLHFETSVFSVDLERSALTKKVLEITSRYCTD